MTEYYKEIKGDLFNSNDDVIAHGVNCMGAMSSGIAVYFKNNYPEMHKVYLKLCRKKKLRTGTVYPYKSKSGQWVFNLATQHLPGANASYDALIESLETTYQVMDEMGLNSISFPQIGCGVGGLRWPLVSGIIKYFAELYRIPTTVVILP